LLVKELSPGINKSTYSSFTYILTHSSHRACATAVFLYVAANIEEIKAKQKVAVEKAMNEQSLSIKSAEESQRLGTHSLTHSLTQSLTHSLLAIEKARKQQQEAISKGLKAAEEARKLK
jgi:hypothetical protein